MVIYGAETHICVKHTAFDLLEAGYQVHVLVDAVSSISSDDRTVGL